MPASKPVPALDAEPPRCCPGHVQIRSTARWDSDDARRTILALVTSQLVALARSGLAALLALGATVLAALTVAVLVAAPAGAEVPDGWSDPDPVDPLHVVLVGVGAPLLLALIIVALVYGPALARGERVAPGAPDVENQWLGGPRKATGELAGPDGENSQAGGASGRW